MSGLFCGSQRRSQVSPRRHFGPLRAHRRTQLTRTERRLCAGSVAETPGTASATSKCDFSEGVSAGLQVPPPREWKTATPASSLPFGTRGTKMQVLTVAGRAVTVKAGKRMPRLGCPYRLSLGRTTSTQFTRVTPSPSPHTTLTTGIFPRPQVSCDGHTCEKFV